MDNKRTAGSIAGIVGGAALAIGAFLTWATVSFDVHAFATLLGADETQVSQAITAALGDTSKSFNGLNGDFHGSWALVAGLIAVALGILLIAWKQANKVVAVGILLAGLIGGGFAVYDVARVGNTKQQVVDEAAATFQPLGIDTSALGNVFDISPGVGIWMSVIGGVVAIAGGVLVLTSQGQPAPADAGSGEGIGMGPPMATGMPMGAPAPPASTPPPTPMSAPPAAPPPMTGPEAPAGGPSDVPPAGSGDSEDAPPTEDGSDTGP